MSRINRKKIKDKSHIKKAKKNRKTLIWTLILVGLMVVSGFGIILSGYSDGYENKPYGNYDIKMTQKGWLLEKEGKQYVFHYHPADIEGLELTKTSPKLLSSAKFIYITFDPETKDIQEVEEARFNFMNFLSTNEQYPMPGIINESDIYQLPITDCNNATPMIPVVKILVGNTTKIEQEGNCIIAQATPYELSPMVDRLSYAILGVME